MHQVMTALHTVTDSFCFRYPCNSSGQENKPWRQQRHGRLRRQGQSRHQRHQQQHQQKVARASFLLAATTATAFGGWSTCATEQHSHPMAAAWLRWWTQLFVAACCCLMFDTPTATTTSAVVTVATANFVFCRKLRRAMP